MTARALAAAASLSLCGCDWTQNAFINSIPIEGNTRGDFYVYLGVDGLSWSTAREAMARGAFGEPDWKLAKLVTMFPGTSDASWTRTLHTARLPGYEIEYYDPVRDTVVNTGLPGLARHILPTVSESFSFEAPYLRAFDFSANGYTSGLDAYRDPWVSLQETLDSLFFLLEGRTGTAFTGYLIENDILGHMGTAEDCVRVLSLLAARIERFRAAHPERNYHFTLFSDHGMDFAGVPGSHLIDFSKELPRVGIVPVEHLRGAGDEGADPAAIPIAHTRLAYLALHTHASRVADVGVRISNSEAVDFAVGKVDPPAGAPPAREWFGVWSRGRLALYFGYVPSTSSYWVAGGEDFTRFGMPLEFAGAWKSLRDEDLFALTRNGRYPDLLYRLRTALDPVGVEAPAQVLISLRSGWASIGFHLPGPLDPYTAGTHGSAEAVSSIGTLLSDERDLPEAVRADGLLAMFPRLGEHLRERGLTLLDGDPDASRPQAAAIGAGPGPGRESCWGRSPPAAAASAAGRW